MQHIKHICLLLLLIAFKVDGQNKIDSIFNQDCIILDTSNTVTSSFHHLELNMPPNWKGEFKGEYPSLFLYDKDSTASFWIVEAYDSHGVISSYKNDTSKVKNHKILTFNKTELLITFDPNTKYYKAFFNPKNRQDYLWQVWARNINGKEEIYICDFSKIIIELIKKANNVK